MTVKEFIDTHALPIVAGVAIASSALTVGVVSYLNEKLHKFEISQQKNKYESEISELRRRFASIERYLGNKDESLFDVTKLLIDQNEVRKLDKSYKSSENGSFFYSEPIGDTWNYDRISEPAFRKLALPDSQVFADSAILSERNIHLWRANQKFSFSLKSKQPLARRLTLNLFPYVMVQETNRSIIDSTIQNYVQDLNRLPDFLTDNASSAKTTKFPMDRYHFERKLDGYFHGDISASILARVLRDAMEIRIRYENTHSKINTLQKSGNIVYVQMSLHFKSVDIVSHNNQKNIRLDREIFIVSLVDRFFIVQVQIPSTEGRSEHYHWASQWLSRLRIPL